MGSSALIASEMKKLLYKIILKPIKWASFAVDVVEAILIMEIVKWFMGYKTLVALELVLISELLRWAI